MHIGISEKYLLSTLWKLTVEDYHKLVRHRIGHSSLVIAIICDSAKQSTSTGKRLIDQMTKVVHGLYSCFIIL